MPNERHQSLDNDLLASIIAIQQEIATAEMQLEKLMHLIAERTQLLTNATGSVIELVEGDELVYRAATGTASPSLGMRLKSATSFSGLCIRTGEVQRCDDALGDPRVNREACVRVGLRSMIVVPLYHQAQIVGVLKVLSSEIRAFENGHIQVLQLMAGLLGAVLSRAAAFEAEQALVAQRTLALRETEERFRLLAEGVKDYALLMLDSEGFVISWNPGAERIKGYRSEEIVGQHFSRFYTSDDARDKKPERELQVAASEGRFEEEGWRVRKDGTRFWANVVISALRDEDEKLLGFAKVTRDVTERKKLEDQLRQSQKMEAIGQLAGGVAHDFNNLLTIITGYGEIVLDSLVPTDPAYQMIEEVKRAGERAASLTRQLLIFSRQQVVEPKLLKLNTIVRDTEKMLKRLIGEDISLACALHPELEGVKADAGHIEQVIVNLVVNARDAMPDGGSLTIETRNVNLDETYTRLHAGVKPGRYVLLAVSDTGSGMDEATQARIFEPFFTTKAPGKGTGLGLATVYGIVKQSSGHIAVYSEPGFGASFKVYLPLIELERGCNDHKMIRQATPKGDETLLLVEDDEAVRGLTRTALVTLGYTVLDACNGEDAVQLCRNYQGPIHLIVTDVIMPGISGRRLVECVVHLRPSIKSLYLSGYTDDAVVRHGVLLAEMAFLQKPFTPTALARKVRAVLDNKSPMMVEPKPREEALMVST